MRGAGGIVALLLIGVALLLGDRVGREDPGRPPAGEDRPSRGVQAEVVRVVDGDTIEVEIGGAEEDLRYIGVDTPETVKPGEPVQCFGPQASAYNRELVERREVLLRFDAERRDAYGRLLAYVYLGKRFVNAELVRGGYARTLEIEPNTARAGLLERLELAASRAGRGLWGEC